MSKPREKDVPSQDHGIGNISTLKLIETKHIPLLRDISRNKGYTIDIIAMLHL
jgi:hypothetical protein